MVTGGRTLILIALWLSVMLAQPVRSALADTKAVSGANNQEVCDPLADYFLGMEDYPEAIRRHKLVIAEHPDNALAHYHLGFAYGMIGDHRDELIQYRDAIRLGLSDWALFLNLGLLYLENNQLTAATNALQLATLLGPQRPEAHFNLGLAYERRGMLGAAEQEMLLALRLDPTQADVLNSLGVIYAEQRNYQRARNEWTDLLRMDPGYQPARDNLAILRQAEQSQIKASFSHLR